METLCRLCGKVTIDLINILDRSNESLKLEIHNLLRIEIHHCDFLPTKVCISCVAAVQEASAFINCCHHVQKILLEKYETDCKNPKNTVLVSKTTRSIVLISPEVEGNRENICHEEHSIILEPKHSIFVKEPKKLTFVDPDELISESTSDPLVFESSISDHINVNSRLSETSNSIPFQNEVESNIGVIQNKLPAPPGYEISSVPYSENDSMNVEELPIIKSEAVEIDDCFALDPLDLESNESYVPKSESLEKHINVESTENVLSAVPISLNGEVYVEKDDSSNSTNFPSENVDHTQDIDEEIDSKSTKTLLCVTLDRVSGSECLQNSACDLASNPDDVMHEQNTYSPSNDREDKDKNVSTSTGPSRVDLNRNLKSTLMSVLTFRKDFSSKEADVCKKLEGVEKGKQLVNKDAWKNYFTTNTFRRESNISMPRAGKHNIASEKFQIPVSPANPDDDGTSNEMDPQKLFDYCMQITKQFSLKKYKYVERPRADRRGNEQPITSDVSRSQPENESANLSSSIVSTDQSIVEDGDPKNSSTSNKNRTFLRCETCSKKFLSKALYDDHLNMHTGYRPFKCDICSRTYRRRSDLTVHIRVIHARGEFKCSLCDYVASYEGRLKVHLRTSHEKPFCCNVCNYRCGAKKRLEEHIINKHQDVVFNPPQVCELCGGSFKGKMSLRSHQRIVHFPEPQVCTNCGKRCPNQTVYKSHVTQCGKEKIRYTCDMCGSTYSKKAVLKEHMNKHLNIKPYECKVCNKQFFLRVRLLTHMAVHRGPTFQCEVCCKSFNRKDNMKSHMKKHFEKEGT